MPFVHDFVRAGSVALALLCASCFVEIADLEGVAAARIDPDAGPSEADGHGGQSASGSGGAWASDASASGASGQSDASAGGSSGNAGSAAAVPCSPKTCASLGAECGEQPDGCGGTLDCGACSFNTSCINHSCQPAAGSICGSIASCPPGFASKATISCGPSADCSSFTQKICVRNGLSHDLVCGASCPPGKHSALGPIYNCDCPGGIFTVCVPD